MKKYDIYVSGHGIAGGKQAADFLRAAGHKVVSTWHDQDPGPTNFGPLATFTSRDKQERADDNFEKITNASIFVMLVAPGLVTGGKFVEAGFAAALGLDCFIVGDRRENLMSFSEKFTLIPDLSIFNQYGG